MMDLGHKKLHYYKQCLFLDMVYKFALKIKSRLDKFSKVCYDIIYNNYMAKYILAKAFVFQQ